MISRNKVAVATKTTWTIGADPGLSVPASRSTRRPLVSPTIDLWLTTNSQHSHFI